MITENENMQLDYNQLKKQLNNLRKDFFMSENTELDKKVDAEEEEITPEKMSIASLIEYCHLATKHIYKEVGKIRQALTGEEIKTLEEKKAVGIFNNCVDLADDLITLKTEVDEVSRYISEK